MSDKPTSNDSETESFELAQAILRGENVPLERLKQFIEASDGQLSVERKKRESQKVDVDFF